MRTYRYESWWKSILQTSRTFLNQIFRDQTVGKPKCSETKIFEKPKKFENPNFGILDLPRWLYIQFFTRNPNLQSETSENCRKTKILRKPTIFKQFPRTPYFLIFLIFLFWGLIVLLVDLVVLVVVLAVLGEVCSAPVAVVACHYFYLF